MTDPALVALDRLQLTVEALTQGLILHGEGLAALQEAVRDLVAASSEERPDDDRMRQTLVALTAAVSRNSASVERMQGALAQATVRGASATDAP